MHNESKEHAKRAKERERESERAIDTTDQTMTKVQAIEKNRKCQQHNGVITMRDEPVRNGTLSAAN